LLLSRLPRLYHKRLRSTNMREGPRDVASRQALAHAELLRERRRDGLKAGGLVESSLMLGRRGITWGTQVVWEAVSVS